MKKQNATVLSSVLLFCFATISQGFLIYNRHKCIKKDVKLFVFGDSYVDTGNFDKNVGGSWAPPSGKTFPGKPDGRFSDGLLFTDYIASFLGIETPVTYALRSNVSKDKLEHGMNFAYGGSGVFDTSIGPNLTTQIDQFVSLVHQNFYKKSDLRNSVALVSSSGNDYVCYVRNNHTRNIPPVFIKRVIGQLTVNVRTLQSLGIRNILVGGSQPSGCLPFMTGELAHQKCDENVNEKTVFHNKLLNQSLQQLNKKAGRPIFLLVDLYTSFLRGVDHFRKQNAGNLEYRNPLKPCCDGGKEIVACDRPDLAFYWDGVHPTQSAWQFVYSTLRASLQGLCS